MSTPNVNPTPPVSPGGRSTVRVVILVIALFALLIPLCFAAFGMARGLTMKSYEDSVPLPSTTEALEVDVANAVVNVRTTNEAEGRVSYTYRGHADRPELDVANDEGTTTVTMGSDSNQNQGSDHDSHDGKDGGWYHENDWDGDWGGFDDRFVITVEVPAATSAKTAVDVDTKHSQTSVTGTYKTVAMNTETGYLDADVDADSLTMTSRTGYTEASGHVDTAKIETRTGAIAVDELAVTEQLTAEARTGRVDIDLAEDTVPANGIDVSTETGAIDMRVPELSTVPGTKATAYAVDVDSRTGQTDVSIDEAGAEDEVTIPISARAKTGSIMIDYV